MTIGARDPSLKKVMFRLEQDEDGYPPADWEHVWAKHLGDNRYQIDNIPFFVRGVSFGDVVTIECDNEELHYKEIVETSGHGTIRVILFDEKDVVPLRDVLSHMGCYSELSHIPTLIAVDVPPEVRYEDVVSFLMKGEEEGRWEYEESVVP